MSHHGEKLEEKEKHTSLQHDSFQPPPRHINLRHLALPKVDKEHPADIDVTAIVAERNPSGLVLCRW